MRPNTATRDASPKANYLEQHQARLATLIVEIVIRESQDTVVSHIAAGLMPLDAHTVYSQAELLYVARITTRRHLAALIKLHQKDERILM